MNIDPGNFHLFFPNSCLRKRLTPRREEIFSALDKLIVNENFDLDLLENVIETCFDAQSHEVEDMAFNKLKELITPLFLLMLEQGFSKEELQFYKDLT